MTSSLNYRQRFALQQSFILQASAMHKQGLGPHKYMLRHLTLEWYVRRQVPCTLSAALLLA